MKKTLLILTTITVLNGCSSFFSTKKQKVELVNDAFVTTGRGKRVEHKKGSKLSIATGESLFVESPGYVGVLVLTDSGDDSTKKIELKPADEWMGPTMQKRMNRSLGDIVVGMNEVQVLLSSRKGVEALSRIIRLEKKYPDLVPLQLLEASCHVVLGDRSKAVMVLTDVLREEPENEQALALYSSLGGEGMSKRLPASKTGPKTAPKSGAKTDKKPKTEEKEEE